MANIGVVAGLIFLGYEVRTTTLANQLAVLDATGQSWFQAHAQIAESPELAQLVQRAYDDEELSEVEERRFRAYVFMRVTISVNMLRAYDRGIIPESDMRDGLASLRSTAKTSQRVRRIFESLSNERIRSLFLDEDGPDKWL